MPDIMATSHLVPQSTPLSVGSSMDGKKELGDHHGEASTLCAAGPKAEPTVSDVEKAVLSEQVSSPQPPEPKKARILRMIKLSMALILPVFLETLDQTVVATAQTRIASQFNALSEQQWCVQLTKHHR
jgi:hypothetical protein